MKKILLFTVLSVLSVMSNAADRKNVVGTIKKIQFMGKNYTSYSTSGEAIAFIYMDELPVSCGNTNGFRRVAITSEHPAYSAVVSAALAAKASGQVVDMHYLDECTLWNSNAWDFSIIMLE
ncbi:hypothetical protein [Teredinibacter sp. KSP-S5-2]|uniref:hypothetical protein n=1 Tax=Teredinibacter sp. KSP-S5-2 TaxID=3034506 RepID=UPI002934BB14|nr:hypothetical protein [Teredinibacter sp. KSP-S5-2]WNO10590.1 hypothetical protein P5V12_05325 [Teredinibacter sp. KSP-S5-2]